MSTPHKNASTPYLYDPLDRLTTAHSIQRFYKDTRIATEIHGNIETCLLEHESISLAELYSNGTGALLATDQQKSVLNIINHAINQQLSYCPYGHRPAGSTVVSLIGFNGERPDPVTGHYLLGQGFRAYNPVLKRFNSPDSFSPFGRGGINAYAYCENNPINYADPDGHARLFFLARRLFKQSDVSDALSRVKKSLGSVNKTKGNPATLPKKTKSKIPIGAQKKNISSLKPTQIARTSIHDKPRIPAQVATPPIKTSLAQSPAAITPIYNFAVPDAWDVQLTSNALSPIFNYAAPHEWGIRLVSDINQFVRTTL